MGTGWSGEGLPSLGDMGRPAPLPTPELARQPQSLRSSLTVWLRKFCISCRPHAFRFSSGVTSYSACSGG